jgi:Papain family cysteine protease
MLKKKRKMQSKSTIKPPVRPARRASSNGNGHVLAGVTLNPERIRLHQRKFDARRDTPDLRDVLYVPSLVQVPTEITLESYRREGVPILDQGREGACTGFALATVIHYLLRRRIPKVDKLQVSPHMLYRMARKYDEWPGEDDAGSSARGAMKGWHRHGVCSLTEWPSAGPGTSGTLLTGERAKDALKRPLGAYFRVNHQDLVAMHAALAEVGILYATGCCHAGWDEVGKDGIIHYQDGDVGGHAFALVAYDEDGFWLQNSWDSDWGRNGYAHIGYDDWLKNGTDAWVARLGVPIDAASVSSVNRPTLSGNVKKAIAIAEVRPHVIGLGNDGELRTGGLVGTDQEAVTHLFEAGGDFDKGTKEWPVKRLLLYAHGGLNDEEGALQRVQDYRRALLDQQIYLVAFIWKTDYWTTIRNALEDAKAERRPEGFFDQAKDFLFNRLDDALEPIARVGTGKLEWDEMKENAEFASTRAKGGARFAAQQIADLLRRDPKVELHVVGHSAGSILDGRLIQLLTSKGRIFDQDRNHDPADGLGVKIKTVTMWAPACTTALFKECYMPAIQSGAIQRFALFTLTDRAEQDDDCAAIYHKSLLYLVSHALEKKPRVPGMGDALAGEPILGMQWWIDRDPALTALLKTRSCSWVLSPNDKPEDSPDASGSLHHGAFDDDARTLKATLARIVGKTGTDGDARFEFSHTEASLRDKRELVMS